MKDTDVKEKKWNKKWNFWHILGFHKYSNCIEYGDYGLGGETKIEYGNPWALFGTRYTHYQCLECGRKFWMPKGNFEEIKMQEKLLDELRNFWELEKIIKKEKR